MRVKVWGCRGSLAAPGPDTVRYGGNTSCVEVRLADDTLLILDAGTGLRLLGSQRELPRTMHIFLTHLHLDHLEGLGFFGPLWSSEVELHVWGPASPMQSLAERIERYFSPPLFPVHLGDVPSGPIFHDAPDGSWTLGGATITAQPISHSGPTVGYRIAENGRALTYMPDHEPMRGGIPAAIEPAWLSGYAIAHGANVLMHDSQYTDEEYPSKIGWGHSAVEHIVAYAQVAAVDRLLMFHHDPTHSDEVLDEKLRHARELWGNDTPELAYEGMEFEL